MTVEYSIRPIPLSARTGASFDAFFLTSIGFPDRNDISYVQVAEWLSKQPLLSDLADRLPVKLFTYSDWVSNSGRPSTPVAISGSAIRHEPNTEEKLDNLRNYFVGVKSLQSTYLAGSIPKNDHYLESLSEDNHIDANRAYEALDALNKSAWKYAINNSKTLRSSTSKPSARAGISGIIDREVSRAIAKHLISDEQNDLNNRAWFVQAAARDDFIRGRSDPNTEINYLAQTIPIVAERARPPSREDPALLAAVQNATASRQVIKNEDLNKLNFLSVAAEKDELIARECGFVTRWEIELDSAPERGTPYVLLVDHSRLDSDGSHYTISRTFPSVFAQSDHTHPATYRDIDEGTQGFTHTGFVGLIRDGEKRYTVSDRNSESELIKNVYLQENNRITNPTQDPTNPLKVHEPELLRSQTHESTEPGSGGITISAAAEDLVTPKDLRLPENVKRRTGALDCLFLEDLWIGYRLDIGKQKEQATSVHKVEQQIVHKDKQFSIQGSTETYFERLQPDSSYVETVENGNRALKQISDTAVITYSGLSEWQMQDLRIFLGISEKRSFVLPQENYKKAIQRYSPVTPLHFENEYSYRLRSVFQGGVSLSEESKANEERYTDRFLFRRPNFFKAGEIVAVTGDDKSNSVEISHQYFLTDRNKKIELTIAPTPTDVETSRLFGQWLRTDSEKVSLRKMNHVSNLSKYFLDKKRTKIDYFSDPDVKGIRISCTVLNGESKDISNRQFVFQNGTYCRLDSHLELRPLLVKYGHDSNPDRKHPIKIVFIRSSRRQVEQERQQNRYREDIYRIYIPETFQVKLTLEPWLGEEADPNLYDTRNYSYIELFATSIANQPHTAPYLQWQERDRVHTSTNNNGRDIFSIVRQGHTTRMEFLGVAEVDAPSTGAIQLYASWNEINDATKSDRYALLNHLKPSEGGARPVKFSPYDIYADPEVDLTKINFTNLEANIRVKAAPNREGTPWTLLDQVGKQCSESRLFFGADYEPSNNLGQELPKTPGTFDLVDRKRKFISVSAHAISRFQSRLPAPQQEAATRKSNYVTLDIQSAVTLSSPRVSHVLPLTREVTSKSSGFTKSFADYAFRIYLERPWFESGIGERLAIGCANTHTLGKLSDGFLVKAVTQWGEDPFERLSSNPARRLPLASDFRATTGNNPSLDENLYPVQIDGERIDSRIYDNIPIKVADPAIESGSLHLDLNSFAVRYDENLGLWYADVDVIAPFFGWIGLALYRHQPHAIEGLSICDQPAWAYASVMYDEPITISRRASSLNFIVGPVFEEGVTYKLASTSFVRGVSADLTGIDSDLEIQSYKTAGATYYQGVIPLNKNFSLVKQRDGHTIAVHELTEV